MASSWIKYDDFLKTYGTHLVTKVHYGARITQWTFAKFTDGYSEHQLNVRSCADFAGPTEVGKLDLKACFGITTETAKQSLHYEMSYNLDILGGTDATRNALRSNRTKDTINKFLNEGREANTPIDYRYEPIWDILMTKFHRDPKRHAIALNLQQYYEGYKDFGCTLIQVPQGEIRNVQLRSFRRGRFSTKLMPTYECHLYKEGCYSNQDCHIGGSGFVTYCYGHGCVEYVPASYGNKATGVKDSVWLAQALCRWLTGTSMHNRLWNFSILTIKSLG